MSKDRAPSQKSEAKTDHASKRKPAPPSPISARLSPIKARLALEDPHSASPEALLQLQSQYGNRAVQRVLDQPIQRKPAVGLEGGEVDSDIQGRIEQARGGGRPLDTTAGSQIGSALGANFSGVRVHTDQQADSLNRSLSAKAFTFGSDMFFSRGAYEPGTHSGKQLLAHELTHVVQQGGGQANKAQTKLTVGPAGDKYEEEADRIAGQVMRMTGGEGAIQTREDEVAPGAQRTFVTRNAGQTGVIQRWGKTAQQKTDETKTNKEQLSALKLDVINPLADKSWPQALAGYKKHNIAYAASGKWGGTKLAKWFRDTNKLDPMRVRAKALMPEKDTKPAPEVMDKIKTIANDTSTTAKGDTLTTDNLSNHQHILEMVEKIAYYLIHDIPETVRSFAEKFGNVKLDLDTELGSDVEKGQTSSVKSTQVTGDEAKLKLALQNGETESRGFHGSASWLLEGLGKSGGKLLSQKSAFEAGLLKTGEGTTFSSGAGLKTNVYIGKGETGFGTAAAYALAPGALTSYNVSLFSDIELATEIESHQKILQLEGLLAQADPTLVSSGKQMTIAKIKEAAQTAGLDVSDPGYTRMFGLQNMVQLKDMLGKLIKERDARLTWEKTDPRRSGGQINPDNYPILLEFGLDSLTVSDDYGAKQREAKGNYTLAGEATVKDEIDLGNGRLKVVYCPEQFISKTKLKLQAVFGDLNTIEVRALESIKGAITKDSKADKTIKATYGQLAKQQKSLDVKMKAHKDLTENLDMPDKIYGGKDGNQELTKIVVRGRPTYVDKDNKPVLHDTIINMMMEGVPQVDQSGTPEAMLTMGGQGAGKSTILNQILLDKSKYVSISADDVKETLPEYQEGLKSGDKNVATKVHQESKRVALSLAQKAILNRNNLIYDATGATKKDYDDIIQKLKDKNYHIKLVMVHITLEEGLKRIKSRAKDTGRNVEDKYAKAAYPLIPPNFIKLAPDVNQALLYDNMEKPPKLVWDSKTGDIKDAKEYLGVG